MIKSKSDYLFYLEADRVACNKDTKYPKLFRDLEWRFQRALRKVEYYNNCKKNILYKPFIMIAMMKYYFWQIILGFSIPMNVFGAGLCIVHRGTIVISNNAKIGENCRIHVCTNIGTQAGSADLVPTIGDNVYIGPGAKIFGDIKIADDIAIGANTVVNKTFDERDISIGGIPAKKISDRGSYKLLTRATEILKNQK